MELSQVIIKLTVDVGHWVQHSCGGKQAANTVKESLEKKNK